MANPTVSNVSLDRASYTPGQAGRLKFDVADADNTSSTVTVTVTDAAGGTGTGTITLIKSDALTVSVVDSSGRVLTKDNTASVGNHYEYTFVA